MHAKDMNTIRGLVYLQTCSLIMCQCVNESSTSFSRICYRYLSGNRMKTRKIITEGSLSTQPSNSTVPEEHRYDWVSEYPPEGLEFEAKRREDAYVRLPAERSPHALLLAVQFTRGRDFLCSGTLLTDRWVLTAAHCLVDVDTGAGPRRVVLYGGGDSYGELSAQRPARGSQVVLAQQYFLHPAYHETELANDVALLKAVKPFLLTRSVNAAVLTRQPWGHGGPRHCSYTGYGAVNLNRPHSEDATRKTHLLEVEWPCRCAAVLESQSHVCSLPRQDYGVCTGDSGGGLLCDGRVVGVVVEIVQMEDAHACELPSVVAELSCGGAHTVSVFENACLFVGWINSHVGLYRPRDIARECGGTGSSPLLHAATLTTLGTLALSAAR